MRPEGDTGVQTHVRTVVTHLQERGLKCELITPYCAPLWQVYPVFGLRKIFNRLSGVLSVWWYRYWHALFLQHALSRRLRTGADCVIYAQCPLAVQAALRARVSNRQRVVMVVHFNISQADEWAEKGVIPHEGALFRAIQKFETRILSQVDALLFVSDFMRRELERRIPGLTRVPTRVIPNFLQDPGEPDGTLAKADLITVGTLEYRKNQRYALEIVHAAKARGRRITLTVVGDGPDRAMLEKLANELEIVDQVRFAGFVPRAAKLMRAHRACLHVARIENLPLTLIEALARGLPLFAPAVGGMPEVFHDGCEGRFIPLDDAKAAARLVVDWLDSPPVMAQAGQAARARFGACFEATRVVQDLLAFLQGPVEGDALPFGVCR